MTMLVDTVEADGGENRVFSNGPGKATVTMAGSMQAATPSQPAAATPLPVEISWQNGFHFRRRGDRVRSRRGGFRHEQRGHERHATLRPIGRELLASKVQLGQPMNQGNMNMSEIECSGQVTIENVSRDTGGVTSHSHMQLTRLAINQQTGANQRHRAGCHPGHAVWQRHDSHSGPTGCDTSRRRRRQTRPATSYIFCGSISTKA